MTILWRRIDHPGAEWCRLQRTKVKQILEGTALLAYHDMPCRLEYVVECDSAWQTRKVSIKGQIGRRTVSLILKVNAKRQWLRDGKPVPSVEGCTDVDLGFSPSTNLLPIKRLRLRIGEQTEVTAAWVEFPSLRVKPLKQTYLRSGQNIFHYESGDGTFTRDLVVNKEGFVTRYPDYWESEAAL
jgi:hypothetical protein